MLRFLLALPVLLPAGASAQTVLGSVNGTWAVNSAAECGRAPYEWSLIPSGSGTTVVFRDRAGRTNSERVDAEQADGFTTTTLSSPGVAPGTRWDYRAAGPDAFAVRNLSSGRQFTLVRCSAPARLQPAAAPAFSDPVALVAWLIAHSGKGFDAADDRANANVLSPGLREALRRSMARSARRNEPPCGANGDIILSTQEEGATSNVRLSAQPTGPDRATVAGSFDVDDYHRDRRYMVVNLDSAWKLENVMEADGSSLRRSLDCR